MGTWKQICIYSIDNYLLVVIMYMCMVLMEDIFSFQKFLSWSEEKACAHNLPGERNISSAPVKFTQRKNSV